MDNFSKEVTKIIWKFESDDGNMSQYILTPTPQNVFRINGVSFIKGIFNVSFNLEELTKSGQVFISIKMTSLFFLNK